MRIIPALLSTLLLLPGATALHVTERDLDGEVRDGASLVLVLEATGSVASRGNGEEKRGSATTVTTHDMSFGYSWAGTVELKLDTRGVLFGEGLFTGGGRGSLSESQRITIVDAEGGSRTIESTKTCAFAAEVYDNGRRHVRGVMHPDTGMLLLVITSFAEKTTSRECEFRSGGGSETSEYWPKPPMSPTVVEGRRLAAAGNQSLSRAAPTLDALHAMNAVVVSFPLTFGHSIVRGGGSAPLPSNDGGPLDQVCPNAGGGVGFTGTCQAAGTLSVRVVVDPCNFLRESAAVHLAAVKAMQKPAPGSSESQVRAFSVDARYKTSALLADERNLQLLCGEDGANGAMLELLALQEKVLEAWIDVAKTHGLSDQGKRELVGAERGRQLMGGGDGTAEGAAVVGAVLQSEGNYGRIETKAHSPVALHAWDEKGRHVGWNDSTDQPEAQIEGANYTGRPGEAQTLSLPAGFYKLATVELGEGSYLLGTSWNASGEEGVELLPLRSAPGRALVSNVLLDEQGMLMGPQQRVASVSAAFVEPWTPLASEPAPVLAAATRNADGDAPGLGRATVPGAGAPAEPGASVPAGAAVGALLALALVALSRRR